MIFKLFFLHIFLTLSLFSNTTKQENITLQLKWKHQFQFAGYYIAKEKGFYKDVGLDVEIKEFKNGVNIVDDVEKQITTYAVGYPSVVLDKALGKEILLLSATYQDSPHILISLKSSGINSIKDFKNKTVMINKSVVKSVALLSMLQSNQLKLSDMKIVEPSFDIDSLIRNEAQLSTAYISNEPFTLKKEGIAFNIWNPNKYGFDFYDDILFTSIKEFQMHPERVQDFRQASIKGFEYAFSHIAETIKLIQKKYNSQNKTAEALRYEATSLKKLAYSGVDRVGEIKEAKIQRIIDIYNLFGLLKKTTNVDTFIYKVPDTSFLSQEEIKYLKEKKVIKMCIDPDWMPYEKFLNNKHIGISADYFRLIEKLIDTKIQAVQTSNWNESLQTMKNKQCDILSLTPITQERKKYMNFTDTFLQTPLVLATKLDAPFTDNFEALQGKQIGIPKDYAAGKYLKKKYPYLQFVEVSTLENGLIKVSKGDLYGQIGTLVTIGYQLQKSFPGELKIAAKFDENWKLSVGVRNDDKILLNILQKSIASIDEKEKQKILNNWLSIKYEKGKDYKLLFQAMGIFLGVFLVLIFFFFRERKLGLEIQAQKKSLELHHTLLETLFDTIPSPIFYKDTDGIYQNCNTAFAEGILNIPKKEIIGNRVDQLQKYIPPHLAKVYKKKDDELFENPGIQQYETQVKNFDGSYRDYSIYKASLLSESKNVLGIIGVMLDITELKDKEKELKELASIDPLSKLYNRRYFSNTSEDIFRIAKREKNTLCIVMLDIDNFKNINDTYGHKFGDDVIVAISQTLLKLSRDSDIVCRYGGEEFILLLPQTEIAGAGVIAEKIRVSIESLDISTDEIKDVICTVSLGISEVVLGESNLEATIKRADDALYKAKETGRNKVCKA